MANIIPYFATISTRWITLTINVAVATDQYSDVENDAIYSYMYVTVLDDSAVVANLRPVTLTGRSNLKVKTYAVDVKPVFGRVYDCRNGSCAAWRYDRRLHGEQPASSANNDDVRRRRRRSRASRRRGQEWGLGRWQTLKILWRRSVATFDRKTTKQWRSQALKSRWAQETRWRSPGAPACKFM